MSSVIQQNADGDIDFGLEECALHLDPLASIPRSCTQQKTLFAPHPAPAALRANTF